MNSKTQILRPKDIDSYTIKHPSNRRENGWNNRFIYGKIQDYNAYHDKYYISMRITQEQTKIYEAAKNDLQSSSNKPYSSKSGYDSTKTPYSKSFNAMMHEEKNETHNNNTNNKVDQIRSLWNDLGVVNDYRQLFGIVADQLDQINKEDFLNNEIESLEYLASLLEKMTKDIHTRLSLINQIKQRDTDIGYMIINSKTDIKESIFDEVIEKMQQIRKVTISIVQNMTKIREDCAYNILGGKFDLNCLSKKYYFDKNYLIKMKDQLDFLKKSNLKAFFVFLEGDPFLLQPIEPLEKEGRTVPINEDDQNDIKKCKYYILMDMIYFQIGNSKGTLFKEHTSTNHKLNSTDAFKQYLISHNKPRECSTQQIKKDINNFPHISNTKGTSDYNNDTRGMRGLGNITSGKNRTIEKRIQGQGMNSRDGKYSQSCHNIFRKGDCIDQSPGKGKIINEHSSIEEESKEDVIKNNELKRLMKEKNEEKQQSIQSKQKIDIESNIENNNNP